MTAATLHGLSVDEMIARLIPAPSAQALLQLPAETRTRILEVQAGGAATLYTDDLERPESERQLVAPANDDFMDPNLYLNGVD